MPGSVASGTSYITIIRKLRVRTSLFPLRNEPHKYVMGVFCRSIRECRHDNILGGAQPVLALSFDFWFGKDDVHSVLLKSRVMRCVLARTDARPTASSAGERQRPSL